MADKLCISREQATRTVTPLVRRKLVLHSIHDTNRRQLDVSLTNSGISIAVRIKIRIYQAPGILIISFVRRRKDPVNRVSSSYFLYYEQNGLLSTSQPSNTNLPFSIMDISVPSA